ncbi:MAG: carbohydrate kinase [Candidatus Marinimicrobia bacterium]|nr:carbohydrate kinase [bacterium]MCG2716194.1 carbohydrate kinase [Candidatus Neomarinimicrobiota bacterium]
MIYYDVISVGELLIDLISQEPGKALTDSINFKKCAGGAPANVTIGMAKLGLNVAFAGKVGRDPFGKFLRNYLNEYSVNTDLLQDDPFHKTRLAFVSIDQDGDRSFEFWEKSPADSALSLQDFSIDGLNRANIVHFGSLPLCTPDSRKVFLQLINSLESPNTLLSFDPNYRESLWNTKEDAYNVLKTVASNVQILKMSLEEALFLSGENSLSKAVPKLFFNKTKILAITRGKDGCFLKNQHASVEVPAYKVAVKDSTGCGDAFLAGLLTGIIQSDKTPEDLNKEEMYAIGQFANGAGAIMVTRYGATDALPTKSELVEFIKSAKHF